MQHGRSLRRSALLVLSLLSACAAAQPGDAGSDFTGPLVITTTAGAQLIARHALAIGDLGEAARAYERMLEDNPNNTDLTRQAFLANLLSGGPETLRLARELPGLQAAQMLLADADAKAGRWPQAEGRYAALGHQGAMDVMRPLLVAWAAAGGGSYDRALAQLQPLMEGQNFRALYTLNGAMIADLAGKDDQAATLYKRAEAEFGVPNLPLLRHVASFLARHGQRDQAEAKLRGLAAGNEELGLALPGLLASLDQRTVRRATDGLAEVYTGFASALRGQSNAELSSVLLRLALRLDPELTSARLLASDISLAAKRPDEALSVLVPVGAGDPLLALVQVRRAVISERLGETDAALAQLDAVSKEMPDRPEPYVLKADILRAHQRYAEAVDAYDRAVTLIGTPTSDNWPLFYNRAIALDRDHKWQRAEADLIHALQLSPDQPYVLNYLGYSLTEQGRDLPRARKMIERAVEQKPDDGAIADSLGWVMLRQGDTQGGLKQLERAAELEPNDATVNMHLGDAYWAVGRKLDAQFQWRRAMTLNPEPADQAKLEAKLAEGEKALGIPAAQAQTPGPAKTVR
jgi:tetratricopeptide (TPR) repeat protein